MSASEQPVSIARRTVRFGLWSLAYALIISAAGSFAYVASGAQGQDFPWLPFFVWTGLGLGPAHLLFSLMGFVLELQGERDEQGKLVEAGRDKDRSIAFLRTRQVATSAFGVVYDLLSGALHEARSSDLCLAVFNGNDWKIVVIEYPKASAWQMKLRLGLALYLNLGKVQVKGADRLTAHFQLDGHDQDAETVTGPKAGDCYVVGPAGDRYVIVVCSLPSDALEISVLGQYPETGAILRLRQQTIRRRSSGLLTDEQIAAQLGLPRSLIEVSASKKVAPPVETSTAAA